MRLAGVASVRLPIIGIPSSSVTKIIGKTEKVSPKTVVHALPCTASLRIPIKEHSKFPRDLVILESRSSQSVHLVGKEFRLTTTGRKQSPAEQVTITLPRHRIFLKAAARMRSCPFVMVEEAINNWFPWLSLNNLRPTLLHQFL